jgi:hypothetical protein
LTAYRSVGYIGFASDTHLDSFNLKVKLERRILTTNKIDASFIKFLFLKWEGSFVREGGVF